jgi:hypothetical protein
MDRRFTSLNATPSETATSDSRLPRQALQFIAYRYTIKP